VTSTNGRYAYTANAASGTISGFSVGHDGTLALLQPSGISGSFGAGSHPLDEAVSRDGEFLNVLVDGTHSVGTFRVAHDGAASPRRQDRSGEGANLPIAVKRDARMRSTPARNAQHFVRTRQRYR
jgi:6-phosphogluconolactonase (cycloisomerase 2 family)